MSEIDEVEEWDDPDLLERVIYADQVCSALVNALIVLPSVNCAEDLVANTTIYARLAAQLLDRNKRLQERQQHISNKIIAQLEREQS